MFLLIEDPLYQAGVNARVKRFAPSELKNAVALVILSVARVRLGG
jgi:hypothetical protein